MTDHPAGHHTHQWLHRPPDPLVRQVVAVVAILLATVVVFALVAHLR